MKFILDLFSHTHLMRAVFFSFFSYFFSNAKPAHKQRPAVWFCFVLFFPGCVSSPSSGTHNAQLPLCNNISALLYTSIMWRFCNSDNMLQPVQRTCRGNVFIFTRVEPAEGVLSFL